MTVPDVDNWYYVGSVIARQRKGKLSILIMKTVGRFGPETGLELWQFIGGMEELCDNGNPLKTLERELRQETGFYLRENERDPPIIHEENFGGHPRYFYALWRNDLQGILRTEAVYDRAKMLEVPIWVDVKFVNDHLCDSQREVWRAFKRRYLYKKRAA